MASLAIVLLRYKLIMKLEHSSTLLMYYYCRHSSYIMTNGPNKRIAEHVQVPDFWPQNFAGGARADATQAMIYSVYLRIFRVRGDWKVVIMMGNIASPSFAFLKTWQGIAEMILRVICIVSKINCMVHSSALQCNFGSKALRKLLPRFLLVSRFQTAFSFVFGWE